MSVVTIEKYRLVTGDNSSASATVQSWLDVAEDMVQETLGRYLEHGVYTERLKVWPTRFAYPAAVPVTSVSASADAELYDEASLYEVSPDGNTLVGMDWVANDHAYGAFPGQFIGNGYEPYYDYATVTYEGGWTSDTMPQKLQYWIAKLARSLDPAVTGRPAGSNLARVGDVQVGYDKGQIVGPLDQFVPGIHKAISGYHLGRL
jgi:hypothetical protein